MYKPKLFSVIKKFQHSSRISVTGVERMFGSPLPWLWELLLRGLCIYTQACLRSLLTGPLPRSDKPALTTDLPERLRLLFLRDTIATQRVNVTRGRAAETHYLVKERTEALKSNYQFTGRLAKMKLSQ